MDVAYAYKLLLDNNVGLIRENLRMCYTFYSKLPIQGSHVDWCQYMPTSLPDIAVIIQHMKLHHFSYITLSKL